MQLKMVKFNVMRKIFWGILVVIFAVVLFQVFSACQRNANKIEWISPYRKIDWNNITQAKAQLHTHTTCTDGFLNPHSLVDLYYEGDYSILAVTDHWNVIYPWEEFKSFQPSEKTLERFDEGRFNGLTREELFDFENRNPESLNMVAIKGCEPSFTGKSQHHMISLFSDITGQGLNFDEALAAIGEERGLLSFAHPGRWVERKNNELKDYINYFDKYPHIYGIDIFNPSSFNDTIRWPHCKKLINNILMHYGSPADSGWRPIWLTATDDLHRANGVDQGLQIQLIKKFNQEEIYNSLKEGAFFWVAKAPNAEVPQIQKISFNKSSITIKGEGFDKVSWYFNNEIVHTGETFDLIKNGSEELFYVYFMAQTSDFSIEKKQGAVIGSQPFWFKKID